MRNNKRVLRAREAAEYLGLTESTLAKRRLYGLPPSFLKLGGRAIGYAIEDLASQASFLEVAYLLIYGSLPNADELAAFDAEIRDRASVPEDLRHLFEAFHTTKGDSGTGLGLYTSKSLAQAQGGDLSLSSTGADGTTFRLSLPECDRLGATPSVFPPPSDELADTPVPGERPTILVLDDDSSLVRALKRWLGRWADVTGTTDPSRALELAATGSFDLVLSDLNMPKMSGAEFVRTLRERSPEAAERTVIMTGSGNVDDLDVRVVRKPIQPSVIKALLHLD